MCWIDALKIICPTLWNMETESSSKSSRMFSSLFIICALLLTRGLRNGLQGFFQSVSIDTSHFANIKIIIFVDTFNTCSQSLAGHRAGSYYFCWNWNYCVIVCSTKIIIFDCDNDLPCAYNYHYYYQLELLSRILCSILSIATANSERRMYDKLKRSI